MACKKSIWLLIILQLCATLVIAQISGVVINKSSGKPVPYASIWIEGENIGISSEEDGSFSLTAKAEDYSKKFLVTSCMGYETLKSEISTSPIKIELTPTSYLLKEVIVYPAKNTLTKTIGLLDRNKIVRWPGTSLPLMIAHYYPYIDDFKNFPFLQKITLVSLSNIKTAQFQIRLFEVSETGAPGNDLIEPLYGYALKGKNYVTVDVTGQNFRVPEKGFFVAFQWLMIDRNKSTIKTWKGHTDKKIKVVNYEPLIGAAALPPKNAKNWSFDSGKWNQTADEWDGKTLTKNRPVDELLFQLLLSN